MSPPFYSEMLFPYQRSYDVKHNPKPITAVRASDRQIWTFQAQAATGCCLCMPEASAQHNTKFHRLPSGIWTLLSDSVDSRFHRVRIQPTPLGSSTNLFRPVNSHGTKFPTFCSGRFFAKFIRKSRATLKEHRLAPLGSESLLDTSVRVPSSDPVSFASTCSVKKRFAAQQTSKGLESLEPLERTVSWL